MAVDYTRTDEPPDPEAARAAEAAEAEAYYKAVKDAAFRLENFLRGRKAAWFRFATFMRADDVPEADVDACLALTGRRKVIPDKVSDADRPAWAKHRLWEAALKNLRLEGKVCFGRTPKKGGGPVRVPGGQDTKAGLGQQWLFPDVDPRFTIDPEFEGHLPAEHDDPLYSSIREEGCREAPTVWSNPVDSKDRKLDRPVLLDGHRRVRACISLKKAYPAPKEREFRDRREALAWVRKHQADERRNLTDLGLWYVRGLEYHDLRARHAEAFGRKGLRQPQFDREAANDLMMRWDCSRRQVQWCGWLTGQVQQLALEVSEAEPAVEIDTKDVLLGREAGLTGQDVDRVLRSEGDERQEIIKRILATAVLDEDGKHPAFVPPWRDRRVKGKKRGKGVVPKVLHLPSGSPADAWKMLVDKLGSEKKAWAYVRGITAAAKATPAKEPAPPASASEASAPPEPGPQDVGGEGG